MIRHLHLDPAFGASGDMLLGTLVALLAPERPGVVDELRAALGELDVDGWSIDAQPAVRNGVAGLHLAVTADAGPARHWSDVDALIAAADLPPAVVDGARRTFRRLGEVEAAQHAVDLDDVHFHEVGAVDAVVDVVGTWWLLDALAVDSVTVGAVGLGHGTVRAAHGLLPLPAPATLALLVGAPTRRLDVEMETCTPTGAALLATAGAWSTMPSGTIAAIGRGAGTKDPAGHPNLLTGVVLHLDGADRRETAHVVSTNVDDVTPEVLGHVVDVLLAAGADDVWLTPIVMKKQRPAHRLDVLCDPARSADLRRLVAAETGSLGTRVAVVDKFPSERHWETVTVRGHEVRVKIGPHGAKPEHDDLVAVARATGAPLRTLADEARVARHDLLDPDG